jgi:hypothetical protein
LIGGSHCLRSRGRGVPRQGGRLVRDPGRGDPRRREPGDNPAVGVELFSPPRPNPPWTGE